MRLQRAVNHVVQHAGAVELDGRDLLTGRQDALGVHLPSRMERHQARCLQLRGTVGNPVLNGLVLGQHAAVGLAVERAFAEHVKGPPRHPEPAHAVMDPARIEPLLSYQGSLRPGPRAAACAGTRTFSYAISAWLP